MNEDMKMKYQFWFVTGSQHLYGPETLQQVEANSREIAEALTRGRLHSRLSRIQVGAHNAGSDSAMLLGSECG